ncbi:7tm 7 domain containing protein, partial [Asbolus verrucosus]
MLPKKISKFFKDPCDVYSAIHPLFYMCTLFGLAPYSLNRIEKGKKVFKFAWCPLLRNVILVALLLGSLAYHVVFETIPLKDTDLQQKLRYFQEVFSSLLSCCAVVFGGIFALKIIEVFKNIDEVDVSFRSLAVWVPYKNLYVGIIVHLVGLFFVVIILTLDFLFLASGIYGSEYYSLYITFMTIILPYFINLLMELQYCHYLNILRVRYKLLNEYLETLVQESETIPGWTEEAVTTVSTSKRKQSKEVLGLGDKAPKSMMAISDPVFVVDQVAALHIKLTDTAHMINYAFCVQQLLRITVAFVSIVTALFLVAVNFSNTSAKKDDSKTQLDYFFTFWAFSNACEVMAIVWITSETCEEIEIYSLQMYHNRLYFTVCGLFPLDYTLLYT